MTRTLIIVLSLVALAFAGCGDKDEGTESDYTPGDGLDGDDGGDDGETDDVDEDGVTEADGQIVIDKAQRFRWEKGQWAKNDCLIETSRPIV